MSTASVHITYRPLRIGFCINEGDFESLRKYMRINSTFWGGGLNPFVVVEDIEKADSLIESYKLDYLFATSKNMEVKKFIKDRKYLSPEVLNTEVARQEQSTILDIRHPIAKYIEFTKNGKIDKKFLIPTWSQDDSLSDIMAITIGQYPLHSPFKIDYGKLLIEKKIGEKGVEIGLNGVLPAEAVKCLNPNKMGKFLLKVAVPGDQDIGIFLGSKDSFRDLVDYWNLRAAGNDVLFVDLKYETRFTDWIDLQLQKCKDRPPKKSFRDSFLVASNSSADIESFKGRDVGMPKLLRHLDSYSWGTENLRPTLRKIETNRILASVSNKYSRPTLSFELRGKPYQDEINFNMQRLVLDIDPLYYREPEENFSFNTIYCPELNDFYAREMRGSNSSRVRSGYDCVGVVIGCYDSHVELGAIKIDELVREFFKVYGLEIQPSKPGLIAKQISNQMGGLRGCQVFKIEGVRKLITEYKSADWFDDSAAIFRIGNFDPKTNKPNFDKYKHMWIEYSDGRKEQSPKDILRFLLRTKVLRTGIEVNCSKCSLKFWKAVNDVNEFIDCSFCGNQEDITPYLFQKKWQFRKSGLFEGDSNQEGAIPVLVSMQQLYSCTSFNQSFFSFASTIKGERVQCESDFIFISRDGYFGKRQVLIAECKNFGSIERKDLENLAAVARRFPEEQFETYIFLSKFGDFSREEISIIKEFVQPDFTGKIIMWSARELEANRPYENAIKDFGVSFNDHSLFDLAQATNSIYLNPASKGQR